MSNISLNEQETTIHFMRTEGYATIYTTDRTSMTRLDRLCRQSPENYQLIHENTIEGEICGKEYRLTDKSLISLRSKKKKISESQRKAIMERMSRNQN